MVDYTEQLKTACNPLTIVADEVVVSSDFHAPYLDDKLYLTLKEVPKETGIKTLVITGDLFDADSYSRFTPMAPTVTFKDECEAVRGILTELLEVYPTIYICRGNHEKRIIDQNFGKLNMRELMGLVIPNGMSKEQFDQRVKVTSDDHITAYVDEEKWMFSHPRNFRIINLSVARDLASKYKCSQIVAHGHQLAQGFDKSGTYRLIDGGGIFDKHKLAYLRETTCYPETKNGFIIITGKHVEVVEGQ